MYTQCFYSNNEILSGWLARQEPIASANLSLLERESSLSIGSRPLEYGTCLIIPTNMRSEVLEKILKGHQVVVNCRDCAGQTVLRASS